MTGALGLVALGVLVGLVMGLLGGGGAVIAVPALVILAGTDTDTATSTSLLVVLVGAVTGLLVHRSHGTIRWRTGLTFGVLGVAGAVAGSQLSPLVPERFLLGLFVLLLLAAALAMVRRSPAMRAGAGTGTGGRAGSWAVVLMATGVGFVTGLLGVGGGFIVVPVLTAVLALPMHAAAATGLVVLAVNAVSALAARAGHGFEPHIAGWLVGGAVAGAFAGARLAPYVSPRALRTGFLALLVFVAVATAVRAATG